MKAFPEPQDKLRDGEAISRNARFIWLIIIIFLAADALGLEKEGIAVVPAAIWRIVVPLMFLGLLSAFYTYCRPDIRIAALAHTLAAVLSAMVVIDIFSYLTVMRGHPLIDDILAQADQAFGLDWLSSYKWVMAHPLLYKILFVAYVTLIPQVIVLFLALNYAGEIARCWEVLWIFIIACLLSLPFSIFWPAVGAFGHYHVQEGEPYVNTFMMLRNGTFRVIDTGPLQGIIQFPSLHAAGTIIFTYAARGRRLLFPLFLLLNILVFASTPFIGGHYFSDLWGGIMLALVTIKAVQKVRAAKSFRIMLREA